MTSQRAKVPAVLLERVRPLLVRAVAAAPPSHREQVRAVLETGFTLQISALHGGSGSRAEARLRALGREWAATGLSTDIVVSALGEVTSCVVNSLVRMQSPITAEALARVVESGMAAVREFLGGTRGTEDPARSPSADPRRRLAVNLLAGRTVPPDTTVPVADGYGLAALYYPGAQRPEEVTAMAVKVAGQGACAVLGAKGGAVLLPAKDLDAAWQLAPQLHEMIETDTWMAVTWRPRHELTIGWGEASKVAALVAAGRQAGTYCVTHVLTEYAAAQTPAVAAGLADVIEPLLDQPVLMDTLAALIGADGNRSLAATGLMIHRSTLDYRLQRIEQLTGVRPTTTAGLHTLATARTLHLIAGRDEIVLPE